MDLSRLLELTCHEKGDLVLEEFFRENGPKNPIQHWKNECDNAQNRVKELEMAIVTSENGISLVQQQGIWLQKEKELSAHLQILENLNSQLKQCAESDIIIKLQEKEKEIVDLKNKIEYYNKVDITLIKLFRLNQDY